MHFETLTQELAPYPTITCLDKSFAINRREYSNSVFIGRLEYSILDQAIHQRSSAMDISMLWQKFAPWKYV